MRSHWPCLVSIQESRWGPPRNLLNVMAEAGWTLAPRIRQRCFTKEYMAFELPLGYWGRLSGDAPRTRRSKWARRAQDRDCVSYAEHDIQRALHGARGGTVFISLGRIEYGTEPIRPSVVSS